MVNSKETCCDPSQSCFTGVCCATDKWVPSSLDPTNMQCCQNVVCNGKCCQSGEICIGNQCSIDKSCPSNFVWKDGKCNCIEGKGDKCQFTRATTCNNHGDPNSDLTPTCDCDAGYCTAFDNKMCATQIGWQPKHDGTGIEPFNLFTNAYGSAYSINTSYVYQNQPNVVSPCLLVLLPGITIRNNPSDIPFLTNNAQIKPFLTLFGCPAPATYYYNEVISPSNTLNFILDLNDTSLLPSNQVYHIEILMPKPGTGMIGFNLPDPNNQAYINSSIMKLGVISVLFIGMNVGAPPS